MCSRDHVEVTCVQEVGHRLVAAEMLAEALSNIGEDVMRW